MPMMSTSKFHTIHVSQKLEKTQSVAIDTTVKSASEIRLHIHVGRADSGIIILLVRQLTWGGGYCG